MEQITMVDIMGALRDASSRMVEANNVRPRLLVVTRDERMVMERSFAVEGYGRYVASPAPAQIIGLDLIEASEVLLSTGTIRLALDPRAQFTPRQGRT